MPEAGDWRSAIGRVYITRSKESVRIVGVDGNRPWLMRAKFQNDGHEYLYNAEGNCIDRRFDLMEMDLRTNQDVERATSPGAATQTEAKV